MLVYRGKGTRYERVQDREAGINCEATTLFARLLLSRSNDERAIGSFVLRRSDQQADFPNRRRRRVSPMTVRRLWEFVVQDRRSAT